MLMLNISELQISLLVITFASIYCIKTNQESVVFKVDPGKSLILSNDDFDASSTQDYVDETYGDQQYFANFVYMNEIKAKAGNNNGLYSRKYSNRIRCSFFIIFIIKHNHGINLQKRKRISFNYR
jgi:hypothetical protein